MCVDEQQPKSASEYLTGLEKRDCVVSVLLLVLQDGKVPKPFRGSEYWKFEFKLGLLRWSVSPTSAAEIQWESLEDRRTPMSASESAEPEERIVAPARESFVEDLWRSTAGGGVNSDLREGLVKRWGAFAAYERHLFGWFVRRFNLAAALRLGTIKRAWASHLVPWIFPTVAVLMALAILNLSPAPAFMGLLWAAVGMVVLCASLAALMSLDLPQILELFIPRLGGTVAIGYLFLAAAPQLIGLLLRWRENWRLQLILAVGMIVVLFLYVMQHIARRVVPRPKPGSLVLRAATVTAIGIAHSAIGLVMFAPLLFSREFLDFVSEGLYSPPGAHQLILCGAIALAIGVILELAWEDKPLTEPL